MKYELSTKSILHQLGIGKSYSGYSYILYAIELIEQDENVLNGITKRLYIDIANKFQTSHICIERNIRKVIEVIWKPSQTNQSLISTIFGSMFLTNKPSNKEFLELLYEFMKAQNTFTTLLNTDPIICPISNEVCSAYKKIIEKLISLY